MLAVVAAGGERGLSRDKLLGYFWPDSDPERGRAALAQALYALRRDLGRDDLFTGTTELRLNPAVLPSDVADFCAARAEGRDADVVAAYAGPLLDGFYLPDAPEFERWADAERSRRAHEYAEALERLAQRADAAGDAVAAVGWWRRLATADPLNARVAVGLMQALAAAGDRGGALQHARVYEALLRAELELDPAPEVVALAEQLRREPAPSSYVPPAPPAAPAPAPDPASDPVSPVAMAEPAIRVVETTVALPEPAPASAPAADPDLPRWMRPRFLLWTSATLALLSVLAVLLVPAPAESGAAYGPGTPAVVAVGRFTGTGLDSTIDVRLLPEMLATSLARTPELQVVSAARMYGMLDHFEAGAVSGDTAGALAAAARQAGARELIEGIVYRRRDGLVRLELQRVDLATGRVRRGVAVEGHDMFELVDRGTGALLSELGLPAAGGRIADVTTGSLVAHKLYGEGVRAYYSGDRASAHRLFEAALGEDSTFAMAAYHLALASLPSREAYADAMQRALRLSAGATERERLLIRAQWATEMDDPARVALAESLATRYPAEIEGHLLLGNALMWSGRFPEAVRHLETAASMDTFPHPAEPALGRCLACEANGALTFAWRLADSLAAAERVARRWTERQPGSAWAWRTLEFVLMAGDRHEEALAAHRTGAPLEPDGDHTHGLVVLWLRSGDFERADAAIAAWRGSADREVRQRGRWWGLISLRMQGRLREALELAREYRREGSPVAPDNRGAAPYEALSEAQILFEQGRLEPSIALFDSIARLRVPGEAPSRLARHQVWSRTLGATPRLARRDTAGFGPLADTLAILGQRSAFGRDNRLHHHVRGLLHLTRGQNATAVADFRRAIFSPTLGYNRTNLELARALLSLGRPAEAVATLQAALRGDLEGAGTYVTRTELQAELGRAWEAAGGADSAAVHYRRAGAAWRRGDPPFAARGRMLEERAARLAR